MKRIIVCLLVLVFLVSFAGCKDKKEDVSKVTTTVADSKVTTTKKKETKKEAKEEATTAEEKTTKKSEITAAQVTEKEKATAAPETTTAAPETTTKKETTTAAKASGVFGSFSATDLNGNTVTQSSMMGSKLTLVNIWATWCGYCKEEMPYIEQCSKTYASQGFKVVGIVYEYSKYGSVNRATASSVLSSNGVTYTNIIADTDSSLNSICDGLCASGVPVSIFVDANGNQVGKTIVGAYTSQENWNYVVEYYLSLV